jgi:hypothetical protein
MGKGCGHLLDAMADVDDGRSAAPIQVFFSVDVDEVRSAAGPD